MLPQTNLQLYRLLIDRGADRASLAAVRKAYDVALLLFGCSVRPSQKPFVAHLIGTAGALAYWDERIDVVIAGLLHSAYLYGDFRDGRRGAHPARRCQISAIVGAEAESLIAAYTATDWKRPIDELIEAASTSAEARVLTVVKLADLWDEISDFGPRFCPSKPMEFGAVVGEPAPAALLDLTCCILSNAAADDLAQEFARIAAFTPPACLTSADRSFHKIDNKAGLDGPPTLIYRLAAIARKIAYRVRTRWLRMAT